jgi:HJR/Mrr/RecB family endonuclease
LDAVVDLGSANALEQADALHWHDFELLVQQLLESKRYECKLVGGKRDHGADIIATKRGESIAVQVKHRRDGRRWIGERGVQGAVTALPVYECARGAVITNSTFAPGTKEIAALHNVILRDRTWLARELASFCVLCGARVSDRVRKWCAENSDVYRGNTYCYQHQHNPGDVLRIATPGG